MRIAFFGIGKLGLPIAACLGVAHEVFAVDPDQAALTTRRPETGLADLLRRSNIRQVQPQQVYDCDFAFICVPTPHGPEFEGVTPLPAERQDFDYSYLDAAARQVAEMVKPDATVVVVSTVLPGATRRHVMPHIGSERVIYSPSFCAMGTVIEDYLHPEGVLVGMDPGAAERARAYRDLLAEAGVDADAFPMSIESAELAKVAYNTAISQKLALVGALGLMCDQVSGADVSSVLWWLRNATRRVASPAYLGQGMGDSGACHPRDNIAMSWLAGSLGTPNVFDDAMRVREEHARYLADLLVTEAARTGLKIVVHGVNYKPGTPLCDGSHSRLVHGMLPPDMVLGTTNTGVGNPESFQATLAATGPHVALVGCNEPWMGGVTWPEGCVVVDPWHVVPKGDGVIHVGAGDRGR